MPAITRANKAAIGTEAAVFLKAADDQKAQVGAALGTQAQAQAQAVLDSRQAQLASMGTGEDGQPQRDAARAALADALFQNLLALLLHHYATPDRVRDYFPEAVLKEFTGLGAPATPVPAG